MKFFKTCNFTLRTVLRIPIHRDALEKSKTGVLLTTYHVGALYVACPFPADDHSLTTAPDNLEPQPYAAMFSIVPGPPS